MKNKIEPAVLMRRCFADVLHEKMAHNQDIYVVTADLGYKMWDQIRMSYPDRFMNVGAAEQAMVGIGIGLALEGKIPFLYSITPFLLYRPFEAIRNYIDHENIPVKLIGAGRDRDYHHDGFSHWAEEDRKVMAIFRNISSHWPKSNSALKTVIERSIRYKRPYYINLKK
jgi:transketolase